MNENKIIIEISAEDDKIFKAVLREPDFKTYAKALNIIQNPDESGDMRITEAGDSVLINCIISEESDTEVLTRPDIRAIVSQNCMSLINIWSANVKKN